DFETVRALVESDWFAWPGVGAFGASLPDHRAVDFQFQIAIQVGLKRVIVADFRGNEPDPVRRELAARQKRRRRFASRNVELNVRQNCNVAGLSRAAIRRREGDRQAGLELVGRARLVEREKRHEPGEDKSSPELSWTNL